MPYFFNKETGLLEQAESPSEGLEYPLVSPEGEIGSAPQEVYKDLLSKGFRAPSAEELKQELDYAKYSSPVEQAKTVAGSAASAATFGASRLLEDPEAAKKRMEVNPGEALAGELLGYGAGLALPGGGALGIASKVGQTAAKAATTKLGAQVAKQAAEMAVLSSGDEVAKAILQDPEQSAQSIAAHIGLSAALGGAFGAATDKIIEPLWKVTSGSKAAEILTAIKDRAQGVTGDAALEDLASKAGLELSQEIKASTTELGGNIAANLREGGTKAANKYRSALEKVNEDASESAINALGRSRKELGGLTSLSEYEEGVEAKRTLESALSSKLEPISKEYGEIEKKIAGKILPEEAIPTLNDRISQIAIETGSMLRPGSESAQLLTKLQKDINNVKNFVDLQRFQSSVREELSSKGLYDLNKKIMGAFREAEDSAATKLLGQEAPELLGQLSEARAGYKRYMGLLEDLNDRLHVGRFSGPKDFITKVKEMKPETVIKRLLPAKDVELQKLLSTEFSEVAQSVRDYQINQLLKKAASSASATKDGIDTRTLFKQIEAMSPELRDFVLNPAQKERLSSIQQIMESLPERINPSGTARALDSQYALGGAAGMVAAIMTGNPALLVLTGYLSKLLGREAPDAVKLGLLRLLGSEGKVSAEGFKTMTAAIDKAYKAAKQTNKLAKAAVAGAPGKIIEFPSPAKISKLKKFLEAAELQPEEKSDEVVMGLGTLGEYMPDVAMAGGSLTARSVNYLSSLKPREEQPAPLGRPRVPSQMQKTVYERALQVAEKPEIVFQSIKDGTLSVQDVKTVAVIYPNLYDSYKKVLTDQVVEAKAKGQTIPYKTIIGMSMFTGMPLNASLLPQNIVSNQGGGVGMGQQQSAAPGASSQQTGASVKPSQTGLKNLDKLAQQTMTGPQARALDKSSNK